MFPLVMGPTRGTIRRLCGTRDEMVPHGPASQGGLVSLAKRMSSRGRRMPGERGGREKVASSSGSGGHGAGRSGSHQHAMARDGSASPECDENPIQLLTRLTLAVERCVVLADESKQRGGERVRIFQAGETPVWGVGAVQRWVGLLDAAEQAMYSASTNDPTGQRSAGRVIEALFAYEHEMTPLARRHAREHVWRRDRPDEPLPASRAEWEACRCRICRYERRLGEVSVGRRAAAKADSQEWGQDPRKEAA